MHKFAAQVHEVAGNRPVILLGYCSGGLVTHALATHLASIGSAPADVALIESDIGLTEGSDPRTIALMSAAPPASGQPAEDEHFADAWLLTACWYVRLFHRWPPGRSNVPTLLLMGGPTPEMTAADPDRGWRPSWPLPHKVLDVPGDQDTVLTRGRRDNRFDTCCLDCVIGGHAGRCALRMIQQKGSAGWSSAGTAIFYRQ